MRQKLETKRDIIERLREIVEQPNTSWAKGKLQALLRSVEEGKAEKQQATKNRKAAAEKKGEGVKATLHRLFTEDPKLEISVDDLIAQHLPGRKPSSILAWCGAGGLGSKKYGMVVDGKIQPIMIERDKETDILRRADS